MSTTEQRLRRGDLIVEVVNREISPSAALKLIGQPEWKEMPWKEKQFDIAWPTLVHFDTDEDIRSKEPDFDASRRANLLKLANALKAER